MLHVSLRRSGGSPGTHTSLRSRGRERALFFLGRHWQARNLHIDGAQVGPAREIEGFPVITAKGEISGRRRPVDDAAQLFALRIYDPYPPRSTTIDVAFPI